MPCVPCTFSALNERYGDLSPTAKTSVLGLHHRRFGRLARTTRLRQSLLNCDLRWFVDRGFRRPAVQGYLSIHANAFPAEGCLRISKFLAITAPNHYRENLVWVCPIKIDESRASAALHRIARTRHSPTDSGFFANVVFGISCGDRALRIRDRSPEQCHNYRSLHGILLGSRERGTDDAGNLSQSQR